MADNYIISNEYGNIAVNKSVIERIVTNIVDEMPGVRLAALKEVLPKGTQNIDVSFNEDGECDITLLIVVFFGTSISNTTYTLINEIKTRVYDTTEVSPASVSVRVIGTETNSKFKRRDLVFETNQTK